MKAKFIFDLSEPLERKDFEITVKALDNHSTIFDVREKIREWRKYRSENLNHEQYIIIEKLLDELTELLPNE